MLKTIVSVGNIFEYCHDLNLNFLVDINLSLNGINFLIVFQHGASIFKIKVYCLIYVMVCEICKICVVLVVQIIVCAKL